MGVKVKVKGGDKLKAALDKIAKKIDRPGTLRVGFLEGATYPDGTSVAMVAAIQEFGAPRAHIPPRPYFRTMVARKSASWPAAIGALLKASNYDVAYALNATGLGISEQLQESIRETFSPPLSPVTVMLRGMRANDPDLVVNRTVVERARARVEAGKTSYGASTKPLIDTGYLLSRVSYEVKT